MRQESRLNPSIVYCAINSLNKEKYIGVTHRRLEQRVSEHRGNKYNGHFQKALKKYGFENFNFYTLSKWKNYSEALEEEKRVIALIKPEYNMTAGGEGIVGRVITEEELKRKKATRSKTQGFKKIICLNDGKVFDAIRLAAEFYGILKHRISTVLKEKEISVKGLMFAYYSDELLIEENRKKIIQEKIQRKQRQKLYISAIKSIPVVCINDNQVYSSGSAAAEHYNLSPLTVANSCNGKCKSRSGLHFKFLENENEDNIVRENFVHKIHNAKKIICIEDNKTFNSIKETAAFYNASAGNIWAICSKKEGWYSAKGKTFKFLENE